MIKINRKMAMHYNNKKWRIKKYNKLKLIIMNLIKIQIINKFKNKIVSNQRRSLSKLILYKMIINNKQQIKKLHRLMKFRMNKIIKIKKIFN